MSNMGNLQKWLSSAAARLDRLSGVRPGLLPQNRLLLGLVWLSLAALAFAFAGHSTKFVYVDF
jgi:hypothetical protein